MAVLEKIRVRMGIFISVIIGLALISFIIDANTLRSVTSMFSSKNDVGKINGKSISYQDFAKKQDYYAQMHSLLTGSTSLSEQMQDQVREQAWQDFFKEDVLYPQYEKCGIEVSDKELLDLTQGRYISPVLTQDPVFFGENGTFSRANVLAFIKSIGSETGDVRVRATYWKYCEDRMRDAQLLEKYMALLSQSNYTNSLELKRRVADRNTTVDINYVAQAIGFAPDSTIVVSEADARSYYKKHEKEFEQETSRDIEFVAFPIEPSAEDLRLAEEKINQIYTEFGNVKVADLGAFVSRNSDIPFNGRYYKKGELPATLDSFAFKAVSKDILPVYRDDNSFYTARIVNSRMMPDSVQARHILIQDRDKKQAELRADTVMSMLRGGANFEYVAQLYSADQVANKKGGDLGWFKQGSMIKAFEDTCFVVPKNKLIKVETPYGWHVVEVTDRSPEERKVQLAVIEKTAHPGKNTYQSIFTKASDLSATSENQRVKFEEAAKQSKYMITPGYSLKEGQKTMTVLPNTNTRELVQWAYGAKIGDVSPVITLDNYFVVASVVVARERGIAPFEQVKTEIETVLQHEQRAEKVAQKMRDAMGGTIETVAEKMKKTVDVASDISFNSRSIAGIGMEPKLQGAVAGAPENMLVGPVKGNMAVYVFSITRRHTAEVYTAAEEKMRERYSLAQREFYTFYEVMEKAANVQDWRGRFF